VVELQLDPEVAPRERTRELEKLAINIETTTDEPRKRPARTRSVGGAACAPPESICEKRYDVLYEFSAVVLGCPARCSLSTEMACQFVSP
jgi:hypothetical protein